MKIYELGLNFDLTDVELPKLKNEDKRKKLKFQKHVKAIFEQLDALITWGSFGIIVGDHKKGDKEPPYVWSTEVIDTTITSALEKFLKNVKEKRHDYLVLAQLGEELHQNGASVPCLVMTSENIRVVLDGRIRFSKWNKPAKTSLKELSDRIDLSSHLPRWEKYHAEVKKVTETHLNSICYIPAVCRRDSSESKVLGGGLVLCVKKGNLKKIFEHMPDIQLFLRLLFTEILLAHPYIGVTVDVPQFVAFLTTKHDGEKGWFKTGSDVAHTYSDMKEKGKVELMNGIKSYVGDIPYNIETHYALKTLSTSGVDTTDITPTMLAILALAVVVGEKEKTCELQFDKKWTMKEREEVKLPIRKPFKEKEQINKIILLEFYKYIKSSVDHDKEKSETGLPKQLIRQIYVDKQSLKISFFDKKYADDVASNIEQMFTEIIKGRKPTYHNASSPLGQVIIWSGYHFCTDECKKGCQDEHRCANQPYIALYSTATESELCISIGMPLLPGTAY